MAHYENLVAVAQAFRNTAHVSDLVSVARKDAGFRPGRPEVIKSLGKPVGCTGRHICYAHAAILHVSETLAVHAPGERAPDRPTVPGKL